jgi:pyridoxamine 5'-phosphate oxidase
MSAADPIARFKELFAQARTTEAADATAVALATTDASGQPSVRMVLLKGVEEDGFAFFTNYGSRKAAELALNPKAALCFFWPGMYTQVRIEGTVEKTSEAESDAYFASRPRGHQLAAWASRQSAVLESRLELVERYAEAEARFGHDAILRPPYWGGFRLRPATIEFWHGFENRLHDRLLFQREGDGWACLRLNP